MVRAEFEEAIVEDVCTIAIEKCIGFLDGSIVVLQNVDSEAYFSRKGIQFVSNL